MNTYHKRQTYNDQNTKFVSTNISTSSKTSPEEIRVLKEHIHCECQGSLNFNERRADRYKQGSWLKFQQCTWPITTNRAPAKFECFSGITLSTLRIFNPKLSHLIMKAIGIL